MKSKPAVDTSGLLNDKERPIEIVTPEGIAIEFQIASMGQRAGALLLDLLILSVSLGLTRFGLALVFDQVGDALGRVIGFVGFHFYFPFCEYRWGATPGKRAAGTRVVDREGAVLSLGGILTRNFMRILEFEIPILVFFSGGQAFGEMPGWMIPVSFLWLLALLLLPLATRSRLRLGDFLGGTMVVETPKPRLLQDLASRKSSGGLSFTTAQLSVYGRIELQVLEDLLRRPKKDTAKVCASVAAKIKRRIGWSASGQVIPDRNFLDAFYLAQREELERLLAFGRGRESKHDADRA